MVYSLDLRKKALELVEKGKKHAEVCEIFGISPRALTDWIGRAKKQDLAPRMNGSKPSKIDNEKLKKYVEEHPDSYLREIAEAFGSTAQAVFYACKRMKITLKKRPRSTKNEMKKNEKNS